MTSLSVIFRASPPGFEEVAGGVLPLDNGTTIHLDGSGVQLMWDLRDYLNLSLKVEVDIEWDDAWLAVVNGRSDLGVPLRTVDLNIMRLGGNDSVSFLHPVLNMPSFVYFRQPFTQPFLDILVKPLEPPAWIMFLFCWFLCIFTCSCIQHFYYGITASDVVLWGGAIIYGRLYPILSPSKLSLNFAMLSSMFLNLITLTSYTAKIVAFFSVTHKAIKGPDDLLTYEYTLSSYSLVHFNRMFQSSRYRPDQAKKAVQTFNMSQNKTIHRLLGLENPNLRYAFLSFPDGLYYLDPDYRSHSQELCGLSRFASSRGTLRAMYINKRSPLKSDINLKLLQSIERGINFRYQKNHRKLYDYNCLENKNPYTEITLPRTLSIFSILIFGAVVSISIEIFNICHFRYNARMRFKNDVIIMKAYGMTG